MELNWKTCRRVGLAAFLLYLAIYYWKSVSGLIGLLLRACRWCWAAPSPM